MVDLATFYCYYLKINKVKDLYVFMYITLFVSQGDYYLTECEQEIWLHRRYSIVGFFCTVYVIVYVCDD